MPSPSPYRTTERHEIRPLIPDEARTFLDVGCNDGGFGAALVRENASRSVWGVEPHPIQAEQAQARLSGVFCGFYDDYVNQADQTFDCVTFNHVLEHMDDPWKALHETRRLLNPGGTVIAVIPNIRYVQPVFELLVRGRWEYTDSGILDRTHLRFFTRASIEPMFVEAGYDQIELRPVNGIASARYPGPSRVLTTVFRDFAYGAFAVRARARRG